MQQKDQKTQKQFIGNHTIFCRSRQLEYSIEILRCAYLSELRSCGMSKFPSSSFINGYFRCGQYYLDQEKQYSTNYLSKSFSLSSITLIIINCLYSSFSLTIYFNLQISIIITTILCNSPFPQLQLIQIDKINLINHKFIIKITQLQIFLQNKILQFNKLMSIQFNNITHNYRLFNIVQHLVRASKQIVNKVYKSQPFADSQQNGVQSHPYLLVQQ